ncbi:hypothetical protein [Nocardia vinacea]|uniref:hypothetical protein n=1 Tax=Nocardia vinacea TaxID=96468 RepID=UPI0012F664EF|nr:hypothetical protein [Nocardia vinacea]
MAVSDRALWPGRPGALLRPAPQDGTGIAPIRTGEATEIERTVDRDGLVSIANTKHPIGVARAGERIILRLDGHLMHAIADNALIGTWPCPVPADRISRLPGARTPSAPLPPPGSLRAQRKVHADGNIMVAKQNIKLGHRYRGQLVTVVIEDTHYRILLGRRNLQPITHFRATGAGVKSNDSSSNS